MQEIVNRIISKLYYLLCPSQYSVRSAAYLIKPNINTYVVSILYI